MATHVRLSFFVFAVSLVLAGCVDGAVEPTTTETTANTSAGTPTTQPEPEKTWLLPAEFDDESGDFSSALEFGPNFWPTNSTISHWRAGEDWILVHTQPSDPDIVFPPPRSWLSQVFRPGDLKLADGLLGGSNFGNDQIDGWLFASESVEPQVIDAFRLGLANDPQPDVMDPVVDVTDPEIQTLDAMGMDFSSEMLDRAREFELIERGTITTSSTPRAVSLWSSSFEIVSLADAIPLDLFPITVSEVSSHDDYEIHVTEQTVLIVADGAIHAAVHEVVGGADRVARAEVAASFVEVDDLRWGEWAWPQLGVYPFLRLAELDSDDLSDESCNVPILDGGCYRDLTPETGLVWSGTGPTLAQDADGLWSVTLPLDSLELPPDAAPGVRVGLVHSNWLVAEIDTGELPAEVRTTTRTRRDGLRLIKMLYPDVSLDQLLATP